MTTTTNPWISRLRQPVTRTFPVTWEPDDGGSTVIGGYAVIGEPTLIDGDFVEEIATGAFAKALSRDVWLSWGGARSPLELSEDERGLRFRVRIPTSFGVPERAQAPGGYERIDSVRASS